MMFNFLGWVFAEGEIITPDSEDNCTLQNIVKRFGMEMSPEKYETIAFLGQVPVRCKIIVTNVYK